MKRILWALAATALFAALAGCDLLGKDEGDPPPYDGLHVTATPSAAAGSERTSREVARQYTAHFSAYAKDAADGELIPIREVAADGSGATFDTVEGHTYYVPIRTTYAYDDNGDGYFDRINLGSGVTVTHVAAPGGFIAFTFSSTGYVWENENGGGSATWNPETVGEAPVTPTDGALLYSIFSGGHDDVPAGSTFDDTVGVTTFVRTFSGSF